MVKVIDAPCGWGKTTWAIKKINDNPDRCYVYCTPFLDEIERIRDACGKWRFEEPKNYGTPKIEDFNNLLLGGKDVAVTHTTFLNATEETLEHIKNSSYTLIIDEALDVIQDFNNIIQVERDVRQKITGDDIRMMLDAHLIELEGMHHMVKWVGGEYIEDKFSEVRRMAKKNRLYCAREKMLLCMLPPEMFGLFEEVYCMTYMFEGSLMKAYFEIFNIEYCLNSIENGEIVEYSPQIDKKFRERCRELITIYSTQKYKGSALSKTWYIKNSEETKEVKEKLDYFARKHKVDMWTCPKDFIKQLQTYRYSKVRKLTEKEKQLQDDEKEELLQKISCFVPCNAKSTNMYGDRRVLMYACNMYLHSYIRGFLWDCNVEFDDDAFALSCLIQWMFRSRIRNGEPIEIFIPSHRMKSLLDTFLYG